MLPAPPRLALVVPALNEAGNIQTVLDRATAALSGVATPWEILVVDDGSEDGTGQAVTEYAEQNKNVRLVTRHDERGLAGAITYGWSQTNADLLGVIDRDLQHPPEVLPALVQGV